MKTRTSSLRLSAVAACALLYLPAAQTADHTTNPTLTETVVTAGRITQALQDVIADMTIVDRDTIEKSGTNSLADILARQPGIELVRNGGPAGSTSLFVRGAPSHNTRLC